MTLPTFPSPIALETVSRGRSFLMLAELKMPVKVRSPIEKFPKYYIVFRYISKVQVYLEIFSK